MTARESQDPSQCNTMTELRAAIDSLDRELVALMTLRQRHIARAAEIKNDREAVRDEARIEDVIAKVLAEARKTGLRADIAEPVWRLLVERSIAYEFQEFDARRQPPR